MLLPEVRLDTLIEQLRALPAGDRRAILARLSPGEREWILASLRGRSARASRPASPYSPDIDALIAAGDKAPLTEAARTALAAAAAPANGKGESLADAFAGLLRGKDAR